MDDHARIGVLNRKKQTKPDSDTQGCGVSVHAGKADNAATCGALGGTIKQGSSHAPVSPSRRNAEREFGQFANTVTYMGESDQTIRRLHAQQEIAFEVQPFHIGGNTCIANRGTEARIAIIGIKRQQVGQYRLT